MINLYDVAARLDADERLKLKYRFPVRSQNGSIEYEVREGKLLDVAEDAKLFYVSHKGDVIWVKQEEVLEIGPNGDA